MGSLLKMNVAERLHKFQNQLLHEVGLSVTNQAAENCPVRSGYLRNSLHYRLVDYDSQYGSSPGLDGSVATPVESDRISQPKDTATVHIGTAVSYASKVENGDPDNPHYPKQPYMSPAIATMTPKLKKRARELFNEVVLNGND